MSSPRWRNLISAPVFAVWETAWDIICCHLWLSLILCFLLCCQIVSSSLEMILSICWLWWKIFRSSTRRETKTDGELYVHKLAWYVWLSLASIASGIGLKSLVSVLLISCHSVGFWSVSLLHIVLCFEHEFSFQVKTWMHVL